MMGRHRQNEDRTEHWTKMVRPVMQTDAWRALSSTAQALYPWVKLEWRGPQANNNGGIRLSVRQAAERMGVDKNTAARAFNDLVAKGFLVQKVPGCLGVDGAAKSPCYEITEIGLPKNQPGRRLYRDWSPGQDFPVKKARANNPAGKNGKTKPRPGHEDNVVRIRRTKR